MQPLASFHISAFSFHYWSGLTPYNYPSFPPLQISHADEDHTVLIYSSLSTTLILLILQQAAMMVLQFVCCFSLFVLNIISPVVPLRSNESFVIGEDYLEWVNAMGSFKRDAFFQQESNDKLFMPCKTIRVSKNPKHFATVQEAINSIPVVNLCRVVISIAKGTYREKIEIPSTMAYVTLVGDSGHKTIIEWSSTADTKGKDGRPLGTYNSATFAINAPFFIAKKITFKNTAPLAPPGALGKQAVALRISGDAASFIGCKFIGSQDTLYDQSGRHYFKNCYIEGSVDFIFGNGLSLYEGCHLHAQTISYGALTAQKRESLLEETGFSFLNCKVTGSGAFYLGRAWGSFSRVVFAYTYMDKIITPRGWYDWGDKNRQMTVFYGQYKCYGPGANYGGRVAWSRELTREEAKPFISLDFISGYEWISNGLIRKFKKWV